MAIFKGAGVAIVTPMYDNEEVNYDKLEEIINNLGSAFSSMKTVEKTPPSKNCKLGKSFRGKEQLRYAEKIKLGSCDYELVEL